MTYVAPVADMLLSMRGVAGLDTILAAAGGEVDGDSVAAILGEAGRFASDAVAPLNRVGDREGARLGPDGVVTAPGWSELYARWREGGWNGVAASPEFGGMGLPILVNSACLEMWCAANLAFSLCPLLTAGAIEALDAHGSAELKATYLARLVSGEWTGAMSLTEPQAGSDLGALRARAERADGGAFRVFGQKIFITYGDHDMTDNIVHLVLARLPGAPPGTRGISLFLVPKLLEDGTRNDMRCHSIEHKLGIHASPTCTMVYGDGEGATGWLVGEENRGLACMFTMMNNARLGVALQGVGMADRAYQQALAYARERRQGRAPGDAGPEMSPIVGHPSIRRMLMTMKGLTQAARAICHLTAASLDLARLAGDETARRRAADRAALLTPIAKAFSTDVANEVASLGVQIHGGMGYIEETGAAQHLRDARILPIYEGTNAIQALDLAQRKLPLANGATAREEIAAMRATLGRLRERSEAGFGRAAARLTECVDALQRTSELLARDAAAGLAGAEPFLRLFALARGGVSLVEMAFAPGGDAAGRVALARFFAEQIATGAGGLEAAIREGAASLDGAGAALGV